MAPFYLDFGKNYHVTMITPEMIAGSQIIFCTYVYNHKRKVKFESGHTPPKSDRVMAPFWLRIWENKQCPDDNSWKDWQIQIIFCTDVYNHKRKVKFESGHTTPISDRVMAPFLLRIWGEKTMSWW